MLRIPVCLIALVAVAVAAAPAAVASDTPYGLAAPGPCARPILARSLVPPLAQVPRAPVNVDPRFHLGVADVAAPGAGGRVGGPPGGSGFPGIDPCGQPGSGCMGAVLMPSSGGVTARQPARVVQEAPAQPGRPPGIP